MWVRRPIGRRCYASHDPANGAGKSCRRILLGAGERTPGALLARPIVYGLPHPVGLSDPLPRDSFLRSTKGPCPRARHRSDQTSARIHEVGWQCLPVRGSYTRSRATYRRTFPPWGPVLWCANPWPVPRAPPPTVSSPYTDKSPTPPPNVTSEIARPPSFPGLPPTHVGYPKGLAIPLISARWM